MANEFSKAEGQQLRGLAGRVYEAEAREVLADLAVKFDQWRTGAMGSAELLQAIHEFHRDDSRDLWSTYQSLRDADIVARGVEFGFLAPDVISGELLEKLASRRSLFKKRAE